MPARNFVKVLYKQHQDLNICSIYVSALQELSHLPTQAHLDVLATKRSPSSHDA